MLYVEYLLTARSKLRLSLEQFDNEPRCSYRISDVRVNSADEHDKGVTGSSSPLSAATVG